MIDFSSTAEYHQRKSAETFVLVLAARALGDEDEERFQQQWAAFHNALARYFTGQLLAYEFDDAGDVHVHERPTFNFDTSATGSLVLYLDSDS